MNILDKITEKTANLFFSFFGLKIKPDGSSEFKGKVRFSLNDIETNWAKQFVYNNYVQNSCKYLLIVCIFTVNGLLNIYASIIMVLFILFAVKIFIKNKIISLYKSNESIRIYTKPDLNPKNNIFIWLYCNNKGFYIKNTFLYRNKSLISKEPLEISEKIYTSAIGEYIKGEIIKFLIFMPIIYFFFAIGRGYVALCIGVILFLLSFYTHKKITNNVLKGLSCV